MAEFPDIKSFLYRNLKLVRQWYLFYYQVDIKVKQPASLLEYDLLLELFSIPWWHNIVIVQKCNTVERALFYVRKTIENNELTKALPDELKSDLPTIEQMEEQLKYRGDEVVDN